jgi:hypothetical protein
MKREVIGRVESWGETGTDTPLIENVKSFDTCLRI